MSVIRSVLSAFLMYSRIPVPRVEWKEENRRYALCFFPLIGAAVGALILLWLWICEQLDLGDMLFAVGCAVIPIAVTGGIHLDGYCDVSDAMSSCADRKRKLEIMKDSHIGAFAAIKLALYLLMQTALFSELRDILPLMTAAVCFVQSRAWSGLAAVTMKNARGSGSLQSFTEPAHRKITVASEVLWICISSVLMLLTDNISGTAAAVGGGLFFLYYRHFSAKNFGGITGDTEGWFVEMYELITLGIIVLINSLY